MAELEVNGIKVSYEIKGTGEPMVFIHGLGSSKFDWKDQLEFFSKTHRVIGYDVRGHGDSGKPKGRYSVPMFADDLAGLLRELKLGAAHLVGLSMGGWIAYQTAISYPDLVKSLTIVNSGPELVFKTKDEKRELLIRRVLFRLFSMRKIGEVIGGRLFVKPEQEEIRKDFVERWSKNHKPSYMASFEGSVGWSVRDKIGEIEAPTLVVAADEDYSPVSIKESYVAEMKDARLVVVEDSRHATPNEHPAKFNQVLAEFFEGLG